MLRRHRLGSTDFACLHDANQELMRGLVDPAALIRPRLSVTPALPPQLRLSRKDDHFSFANFPSPHGAGAEPISPLLVNGLRVAIGHERA
jgi:hypothetical protein